MPSDLTSGSRVSAYHSIRDSQNDSAGLTFCAQRLRVLVDHWLLPCTQAVHDAHIVLRLSRETGDFLTLYDGLLSLGVEEISKDRWAVAASVC